MKRKLAICVACALCVWVLGLMAGLGPVAVSQQETVTPTPTVTATPPTQVEGMTADQILAMISSIGVTPAHSYLTGGCGDTYGIKPVIDKVVSHDINHDGQAELLVDIHCDHYATSGDDKLLVILQKGSGHWLPMFAFYYIGTWSEITFTDFDQDGEEEIAITGSDPTSGTQTGENSWDTTFIHCSATTCHVVWQFQPAFFETSTFDYMDNVESETYMKTDWELVQLSSNQVGIVTTKHSVDWYGALDGWMAHDLHSKYDIQVEPTIKQLFVKRNGIFEFAKEWQADQGYKVASEMPRKIWQDQLKPELASGYAYACGFQFDETDVNNLIDIEVDHAGFIEPTQWYGWRKSTVGFVFLNKHRDSKDEEWYCELATWTVVFYSGDFKSLGKANLSCNPPLTDLQVRPLGGVENLNEYLLVFTVESAEGGSPYEHLLVYRWDGNKEIKQVDDLKGRLYLFGLDGITLQCDEISPCRVTVQNWGFNQTYYPDESSPAPPTPTYRTLVWDSVKEKFLPTK